jgi:ribosome-binding protein aMBF1 (putative translation factor)
MGTQSPHSGMGTTPGEVPGMSYADQLRELEEKQLIDVTSEEVAFNKLLGYNIAAAREKKGLMQKNLAELVGMSQSAWSRIETGESRITVYDLMVCAKVLDRPLRTLIPP